LAKVNEHNLLAACPLAKKWQKMAEGWDSNPRFEMTKLVSGHVM
jgi:uncharacterized protein YfbU (UPF0304 family)